MKITGNVIRIEWNERKTEAQAVCKFNRRLTLDHTSVDNLDVAAKSLEGHLGDPCLKKKRKKKEAKCVSVLVDGCLLLKPPNVIFMIKQNDSLLISMFGLCDRVFFFFGPKPILWQLKCKGIVHLKLKTNPSGISWRERISPQHCSRMPRSPSSQTYKKTAQEKYVHILCGVALMSGRL